MYQLDRRLDGIRFRSGCGSDNRNTRSLKVSDNGAL
jgi:hypothetical protein